MDYLKLHLITISTHKFVPFRKLTTYVLQSTTVNIVLWNDLIIKNTRRNIQTQCVGRALNCSAVKPDFIHIYIYISKCEVHPIAGLEDPEGEQMYSSTLPST